MESVLDIPIQIIPAPIPEEVGQPAGREFNLILMVKEHGPIRLAEITKEVARLEKQLHTLGYEAGQLEALMTALN